MRADMDRRWHPHDPARIDALIARCLSDDAGAAVREIEGDGLWEYVASQACLAGVGGHVSGMVASVKGSDKVLVLDGCPVGCAKKCVEEARIEGYEYVVVTELGIEKKHTFDLDPEELGTTSSAARDKLGVAV